MKSYKGKLLKTVTKVSVAWVAGGLCCTLWAGQVSMSDEFDLGAWSPFNTQLQKTVPVCIWNEAGDRSSYRIKAAGFNSSSSFFMTSDTDDSVPYEVYWVNAGDANDRERLQSAVTSQRVLTITDEARCENGPSGLLYLRVNSTAVQQVDPGVYSDTIEFTISPL